MRFSTVPPPQGLYHPAYEHESCGIGFVVDIKGRKSRRLLDNALDVLAHLNHRGARGSEPNTGDGAGVLLQIPHAALHLLAGEAGCTLPEAGAYGVGMCFLPVDRDMRRQIMNLAAEVVAECGQKLLGWRDVPTDAGSLGRSARAVQPHISQLYVGRGAAVDDDQAFERRLYVIRKILENRVHAALPNARGQFYIASLSHRTVVYKGMLTTPQLRRFYPELDHPAMETAIALVHSRFSTNTFPSWDRAHPYRYLMHNGEINTVQGNENWMRARQELFRSELFGADLAATLPVIDPDGSDSAKLDNTFELMVLGGRSVAHAFMMLIPEPWANHESMSAEKKAFYEYHASLMESWDGPASVAFTDGIQVGAVLDRNGLRPSRYCVTRSGLVILASEVGVLDLPADEIVRKDRLRPGRMLLVDTSEGRIIDDAELKSEIAGAHDYAGWLRDNLVHLGDLPDGAEPPAIGDADRARQQRAFGYTFEDLRMILEPMTRNAIEPVGSMGNDAPPAVLSDEPKLLYNYFKQLFAQVTNPPIDANREELVTSAITTLGGEGDLLHATPQSCRQIRLESPVLSLEDLEQLRALDGSAGHRSATLAMRYPVAGGGDGLRQALDAMFAQADAAIAAGADILILSDRGIDAEQAPIPALLATSAVHHHLIRAGTRTRVGLVVESGEPREVHHLATLIGYGAGAICPYLAYESIDAALIEGLFTGSGPGTNGDYYTDGEGIDDPRGHTAKYNYRKALLKGIVKVLSKMGISTIQAYRGAQIFESVGISREVVDRYFTGTAARLSGIGLAEIAGETAARHLRGYAARAEVSGALDVGGEYQWRNDGEHHLNNPATIHKLQQACRDGDYGTFKEYSAQVDSQQQKLATLRGLLALRTPGDPVPLDEVEPVSAIVTRFKTGAMSYGSISKEAHETLAIAMNRIGGKSNTGEGGEDPARYVPDDNGDSRNSAIKQVASARFGVTSEYLVNSQELQIKMAQGAKPGEGGQLPGTKVYPWIAEVRHSTPGVGLISPPPHHDIYSIEDLAELIHDLKNANTGARINVKLVSEVGVGTVAAGVAKAHADVVLISGAEGGTGASPVSSIKHAGLPWELGISETHQTLLLNDLRSRIVVEADGQLKTGRDVVIAALLGAEEFGFATAPIIVMGCIMMRVCHLNTCPVGVATQDPELREKFTGDPAHVVHFMEFVAEEVRELMASLGFRTVNEMIGRVDCLEPRRAIDHWKARGIDLTPLLHRPEVDPAVGTYCQVAQDHGLDRALDNTKLIDLVLPQLERGETVRETLRIGNPNRVVGTILGSEITRRYGAEGLPEDRVQLTFNGSAGQSFGAFIPPGLSLILVGDSNDYIGKGLSGGKIIVKPPAGSTFAPENNVIIGNVAFYGATSGSAYVNGVAGERFCVRNSGAHAVAEGVGDHGCEYMTGGRVVVIGSTGRNFAAGMSGGIAYVLDLDGDFGEHCNTEMADLVTLEDRDEIAEVRHMIERHLVYTGSPRAQQVLGHWDEMVGRFVKVYPRDYRHVLEALERVRSEGLTGDEAVMAAFEENVHSLARISGN
ncbi:MAG: glutamate synthase large subunit [Spirochaetaceae bacterium]|nr:glutamate synthase large subunit [Spirochaetaceae bacterium]